MGKLPWPETAWPRISHTMQGAAVAHAKHDTKQLQGSEVPPLLGTTIVNFTIRPIGGAAQWSPSHRNPVISCISCKRLIQQSTLFLLLIV